MVAFVVLYVLHRAALMSGVHHEIHALQESVSVSERGCETPSYG